VVGNLASVDSVKIDFDINTSALATALTGITSLELGIAKLVSVVFEVGEAIVSLTSDFVKMGIEMNVEIENMTSKFDILYGSMGEATDMTQKLVDMMSVTPYTFDTLNKSADVLITQLQDVESTLAAMDIAGDIGLGSQDRMYRAAQSISKVIQEGYLSGMEKNRFSKLSINIIRELQKLKNYAGKTASEMRNLMRDKMIPATDVVKALDKMNDKGGLFYNAMIKGAKTVGAQWETVKDTFNLIAADLTKPIFAGLIEEEANMTGVGNLQYLDESCEPV